MYLDIVKLYYLRKRMPRVVLDQRGKFNSDELFTNLSRPNEVKYVDLPSGSDEERREKFLQDCKEGRIDIAFTSSGFNLELHISSGEDQEQTFMRDKIDLESDPPKAQICSHFILNGVCVRWQGWIDCTTLKGSGSLEFDEQRAEFEEQRLRQELATIDDRYRTTIERRIPPSSASATSSAEQEQEASSSTAPPSISPASCTASSFTPTS